MITMKPIAWVKAPRQARSAFDQGELKNLAANIAANGVMNAIECLPDGEIVSGHRRYQAAVMAGLKEIPVKIIDGLTPKQIRIRRVSENLQRSDLAFWDKYLECSGFEQEEPGITHKEIAAALNVDESTVTRYLCPDRCILEVRNAAKDGKITMKKCYDISKLPMNEQLEALNGKAKSYGDGESWGNKVKCPLPNDVEVVITGSELSLDDIIEALAEAQKELKKAGKMNIDGKTFEGLMKAKVK